MTSTPQLAAPSCASPEAALAALGIHGYDRIAPAIVAALVSGDPLLLIGKAGTGKTFLLNRIAEALGLEHRHYNASLVAFDDLVGFPMPTESGDAIRYLETPATAWHAQSILIDEINRCRPEHQNRFFSIIHERLLQGLPLERLQFRWAAMNPLHVAEGEEQYSGVEPLDPALADRFAFLVEVPDWDDLDGESQTALLRPRGTDLHDASALRDLLETARDRFEQLLAEPPAPVETYFITTAWELEAIGVRTSPRRVKQWVRNAMALHAIGTISLEESLRIAVSMGFPQLAWSPDLVDDSQFAAVHQSAVSDAGLDGTDPWLTFFRRADLKGRIELLFSSESPDLAGMGVKLHLSERESIQQALFALALFPGLIVLDREVVSADALADLGDLAVPLFHTEGAYAFYPSNSERSRPDKLPDLVYESRESMLPEKRRTRLEHLAQLILLRFGRPRQGLALEAIEEEFNTVWEAVSACVEREVEHERSGLRVLVKTEFGHGTAHKLN